MAQLGNILRITLSEARIEHEPGFLPWQRKPQDQNVWLDWEARTRRRQGADWIEDVAATGAITGAEIRFWADFFNNAAEIHSFPARLGPTPMVPVARLWTPLAGMAAEFFLWPEPTGSLVLMALFTPDPEKPHARYTVETTAAPEALAAFAASLVSEYELLKSTARAK